MNRNRKIVAAALVAAFATFHYIVVIENHYIMPLYYFMYGGVSEVYPHYYEGWEAMAIAIMAGVIAGSLIFGIIKIFAKIKFPQQKRNSAVSQ